MQSAIERREQILEILSDRRFVTLEELANECGCSKMTVRRDIDVLTCSAPIYTKQGGAGGIRVADGWYLGRRYLHDDQETLLIRLSENLNAEDKKKMDAILLAFGKPKTC